MGKYEGVKTKEISFPLGGIGTGCIGLSGNGRLVDWEIFNRPAKGSSNGFSNITVRAIGNDGQVFAKALNGDLQKDFMGQYTKGGLLDSVWSFIAYNGRFTTLIIWFSPVSSLLQASFFPMTLPG
jgi:uncharacterized protein (DUF608 family)